MDETLPDSKAITVQVPVAEVTAEERSKAFPVADITHFVVQLSDKRLDSIIQSVAGVPYNFNKPWPFWFFIGKIVSKAFFDDEEQLEWLNAVRVRTREFIAFTNTQINRVSNQEPSNIEEATLWIVDIGVPYIFMSEATGWPLSKFWKPVGSSQLDLDKASKARVLTQLGVITWKLSQLRFDKIGSLFEEDGSIEIKECLSRGHMLHGRYDLEIPRGPFASEAEFYDSLVSAFSEHVEILQLSHHCFVAPVPSREDYESSVQYKSAVSLWNDFVSIGRKTDSSDNRLDYIIAGDALRHIIRKLELPVVNPATFPLCHADLSVNNIYVDDNYSITCIIDWAFTSSIPESMLLAAPGLPQYRDELPPELQLAFINGFIASIPRSIEEKLVRRDRESLEQGQAFWRLSRLLNLDSFNDYNLFATIWNFIHGPGEDVGEYFSQQRRLPHYIQLYNEVQEEDQPPSKIEKDEKDYFQNKDFRNTIARKLTLISEWKTQYTVNNQPRLRNDMFVASPKLWKWIQEFMQDWEDGS